jgi:hypothetical protein
VEIDLTRPKRSEVDILRSGGDWSSYSAQYDGLVAAEFQATAHRKQREAEAARLALIDENFKLQRQSQMNWSKVQIGLALQCACGEDIGISGSWRDGTVDDDPREVHAFRESTDNHLVLTAQCGGCGKNVAVDLGRVAPSAPRNFLSLPVMKATFGIAQEGQ